jgi:hypothetical protein
MNNNGIDMGGNFILQYTCYIYDRADTKKHKHIVGMLQGKPKAPWNKYLVQISCRLFEIWFNWSRRATQIHFVSCYDKFRLTYQGKWD